jgi:hypothetical protein
MEIDEHIIGSELADWPRINRGNLRLVQAIFAGCQSRNQILFWRALARFP